MYLSIKDISFTDKEKFVFYIQFLLNHSIQDKIEFIAYWHVHLASDDKYGKLSLKVPK